MKIVYRASNIAEAHIVSGLLESNGIESHVGGFYLQGGVGELAAMDFANVQVLDEDFDRARTIIAEYEGKPDRSPEFPDIKEATSQSNLILTILAALFIVILFIFISS